MKAFTVPITTKPRNSKIVRCGRDITLLIDSSSLYIELYMQLALHGIMFKLEKNLKQLSLYVGTYYVCHYQLETQQWLTSIFMYARALHNKLLAA